ncbi:MAG: glucans biosynthesis glucosyltransferase MdoH [Alphaproteobacteria bacterium]|nr:glucans biosynthesis glucosyltransferase MdoH [Alphaproteobacteria bacterium]MBU1514843.1 glucans biosynthesis glucosyltransferase MdoH [Alphaproteobacteria bacterium]MBU2093764.1 glucans biosynthesis glucosyltransferase MdoH [Alphaproteobacteria bacterium]MBU2149385.1 glucans biosynthesis glucosyltransferase MdoH [Alphaproteobacteria bacterium]MBU2305345.1 glucans biosynthesis glucosyltransferase MdoH [Alphaproteobacteria bacterium]
MARVTRRAPKPTSAKAVVFAAPEPFLQSVPAGAPLDMPEQDLRASPGRLAALLDLRGRRVAIFGGTAGATAVAGGVMASLLSTGGFTVLDAAALALFLVLFGWTVFGFASATAGFVVQWRAARPRRPEPQPVILTRTALLMPTYNEDPGRVLAAVQAIREDLVRLGVSELYDVFLLSDTRDETTARHEVVGMLRVRARLGPDARIFYRRRPQNTDRKAGNVADWVRRFGGAYEAMIILDADSVMSADTIVRLTAEMEADPKLGLLQTAPNLVGAETLFARLQQFAARTYGGMLAAGQDWWSGAEGNYWGHNAIIRVKAFASCAGLPHLPGRRPFGGHIMSHDFVEAALMRRGGWAIRLNARLGGSYEEAPPTIVDMARRDRRWCQGNLQHLGVVGASGLHWISRLHLARGVLSYVTSPLWLLMVGFGATAWLGQIGEPVRVHGDAAVWLFATTMAMLITPKLLAGVLALRERTAPGARRTLGLWVGIGLEVILSALVAPVLMLMQSAAVFDVLIGRDSGWNAQQRDAGRLSRKEAWRSHRGHVIIGVTGAVIAWLLDPAIFWWTSPVSLGLFLSAPLSLLMARTDLGGLFRTMGLLTTPEERQVPPVVARAVALRALHDEEQAARVQIERLMRAEVPVHRPEARALEMFAPRAQAA